MCIFIRTIITFYINIQLKNVFVIVPKIQIIELNWNSSMSSSRTITEEEVSRKISDGVTKLLIIDNVVYDVTNYLNR
jgi:cytochrome b involved in lipid metabolism